MFLLYFMFTWHFGSVNFSKKKKTSSQYASKFIEEIFISITEDFKEIISSFPQLFRLFRFITQL